MKRLIVSSIAGVSLSLIATAHADVNVPGTANPFLAGVPAGQFSAYDTDSTPFDSPTLAGTVTAGSTVTWTATGLVNNGPGIGKIGPDGDLGNSLGYGPMSHPAEFNVSGLDNVPMDALVGVFLGPNTSSTPTPPDLDYSSLPFSYSGFTPDLDQVFYMGDGSAQSIVVPAGATMLYLGTVDGFQWNNNGGNFKVDFTQGVTPSVPDAASTLAMMGAAFGLIGAARRKLGQTN